MSLGTLLAVFIALFSLGTPAWALKEYRSPKWTWCIYDCSYSGDYDTPEGAVDGWNAAIDGFYNQCIAQTTNCGGGCYKVNHYDASIKGGGFAILNGQSTFLMTAVNVSTQYIPACNSTPAKTYTTDLGSSSIAAAGRTSCPEHGGWSSGTGGFTTVLIGGTQTTAYQLWCEKDIPQPQQCTPKVGNPIGLVEAAKTENETDYSSADGLLQIRRIYSSVDGGRWSWGDAGSRLADFTGRSSLSQAAPDFAATIKAVPPGYYSPSRPAPSDREVSFPLLKTQPDTGQKEAWLYLSDGRRAVYKETAPGVFTSPPLARASLNVGTAADGSTQWTLKTTGSGFDFYDLGGSLVKHVAPDGMTVGYITQGNSLTVSTLLGSRSIIYQRDPTTGIVTSATLPDGSSIAYSTDSLRRVLKVTYPDLSTKTYLYNEAARTGTTVTAAKWLTGIVDENNVRRSSFTYDGVNPISTETASGVNKFSVAYYGGGQAGSAIVTPPNGGVQARFDWELGPQGERRLVTQSQPAGAGCAATTSRLSYDTNGNVSQRDDFNGTRSCYANDLTRDLETTRVEGLSQSTTCSTVTPANATLPATSRKVSTQWHPEWRLSTQVAEPGKITTSIYNGQPDPFNGNALASCAPASALLPDGKPIVVLCKQVEQATTDTDGHLGFSAALQAGVPARTQSWTYNQYGQVLSAKGPRTDVNDTTTYAYYSDTTVDHTLGDLQTVTNPAGQVTSYTKYNKHGQVLQSSDPNGVLTVNTYDLRQRLKSTTVAGQTTSYDYDAVGQLKKVTLPDTSWIGYDYDDAHRQVAVYDNQGNRTEYVLDNAGNKTGENVKDPSGNLKRQLSRSIDALGRVQQTTGRE